MDALFPIESFVTLAVLCAGLLVVAWHDYLATARAARLATVSARRGFAKRPR
jgi:hypothetical protein